MTKETFHQLETFMLSCMADAAHDREHVYRVLYQALELAEAEAAVDRDVLIAACLLHDISRGEQLADPTVCHARAGAEKAYRFLLEQGFSREFAEKVRHCIATHRYRSDAPPQSIEAKLLFDADKLDVSGAVGIARTLLYGGRAAEPLYALRADGSLSDGTDDGTPSFLYEYQFKLKRVYSGFYTARAAELARTRQDAAAAFYDSLCRELRTVVDGGREALERWIV